VGRRGVVRKGVARGSSGLFRLSDAQLGDSQDHFAKQISSIVLRKYMFIYILRERERKRERE